MLEFRVENNVPLKMSIIIVLKYLKNTKFNKINY